jgi:hypothetical protein
MSTNFIFFGPTDQELCVFEVFRRSLRRAGMCWSQPTRVDHMCKKLRVGGKTNLLQRVSLGHPSTVGERPGVTNQQLGDQGRLATARNLTECGPFPATPLFLAFFFLPFFLVLCRWAWHLRRMGVQHPHFLKLAPTLGSVKSSIPHGAWRFHFFSKKNS